jgi:hypothetical protein
MIAPHSSPIRTRAYAPRGGAWLLAMCPVRGGHRAWRRSLWTRSSFLYLRGHRAGHRQSLWPGYVVEDHVDLRDLLLFLDVAAS